jgi:hypothetical protein
MSRWCVVQVTLLGGGMLLRAVWPVYQRGRGVLEAIYTYQIGTDVIIVCSLALVNCTRGSQAMRSWSMRAWQSISA